MKINELTSFLVYYKALAQIDDLPAPEYIEAMYNELKDYDSRYIQYAFTQVSRNEMTFNKYPLLAQILKYIPDFSIDKGFIADDAREIKKYIGRLKPGAWDYDSNIGHIAYYSRQLGSDTPLMTESAVDEQCKKAFAQVENNFFTTELPTAIPQQRTERIGK